ncbi:MAG: SMC-Scp complex subunit ScpB [Clostridia bacterium]|nr:SMC-Scp complex subunit ScpB [Clostridia bacterium]MBQ7788753.1 SMC-Scp complex subunit ScpB [Clostridia bacterium]
MDNNAIEKINDTDVEGAIEAILFAAGHPITYAKLGESLEMFEAQVKKKVLAFAERYNKDTARGIMLLAFEDSCQLCTKEQYLPLIKEALGIRKGGNLSASSLEVLAIIAYNEPVTRAFIDTVRKVDSAYVVNSLCEKNLIEACGRLDVPGRPHIYRTTPTFLRCFGIDSLEQLPYIDIPRAPSEGEIIPLDIEVPTPRSKNDGLDEIMGENSQEINEEQSEENGEI